MAPIPSHHMASHDSYSTYLVVLKIHGSAIRLFDSSINSISKNQSHRILCHNLESSMVEKQGSGIQVFVLNNNKPPVAASEFQTQQQTGQEINSSDLAIFMSAPIHSTRKASYALDIGVSIGVSTSMEDLSGDDCKKVGTAYIYLEPKFSTQGVQRMQILGTSNNAPIGQIQVEYLIVTNPAGYKVQAPRPQWLSHVSQLDAGHRGAGSGCRGDLPGSIMENTVASFNYAAKHGADMCELDVMCTADGVPVVYHNYTLSKQPGAVQIDELTLDELHLIKHHTIHDENCNHNKDKTATSTNNGPPPVDATDSDSNPFPTLKDVLRDVDKSCALNIELKWAQLLPNGKNEAVHYREINDYVDRVLDCIFEHSHGRSILLSTLNANIAILLRLKQTKYPVLFLTTGDSSRFFDPATKTIKNAIHFAQAFDMAGINPNAAYLNEYLVRYAQDCGLLVYAWGKIESAQAIKELRRIGLNGVIYDKIDLIKPHD